MSAPPKPQSQALVDEAIDLVPAISRQVARELALAHGALDDDLQSAGREGLFVAAQRFDASRGVPFRSYASHRIRGAMLDALRREGSLPRRAHNRLRALEAALDLNEALAEDLAGPRHDTSPSSADQRLADQLASLATALATGLAADAETATPEPFDPGPNPEEAVSRAELHHVVTIAIKELPEQERVLVERHYFKGERFDEIAQHLGLSKSWASRLHARAISRLTAQFITLP